MPKHPVLPAPFTVLPIFIPVVYGRTGDPVVNEHGK